MTAALWARVLWVTVLYGSERPTAWAWDQRRDDGIASRFTRTAGDAGEPDQTETVAVTSKGNIVELAVTSAGDVADEAGGGGGAAVKHQQHSPATGTGGSLAQVLPPRGAKRKKPPKHAVRRAEKVASSLAATLEENLHKSSDKDEVQRVKTTVTSMSNSEFDRHFGGGMRVAEAQRRVERAMRADPALSGWPEGWRKERGPPGMSSGKSKWHGMGIHDEGAATPMNVSSAMRSLVQVGSATAGRVDCNTCTERGEVSLGCLFDTGKTQGILERVLSDFYPYIAVLGRDGYLRIKKSEDCKAQMKFELDCSIIAAEAVEESGVTYKCTRISGIGLIGQDDIEQSELAELWGGEANVERTPGRVTFCFVKGDGNNIIDSEYYKADMYPKVSEAHTAEQMAKLSAALSEAKKGKMSDKMPCLTDHSDEDMQLATQKASAKFNWNSLLPTIGASLCFQIDINLDSMGLPFVTAVFAIGLELSRSTQDWCWSWGGKLAAALRFGFKIFGYAFTINFEIVGSVRVKEEPKQGSECKTSEPFTVLWAYFRQLVKGTGTAEDADKELKAEAQKRSADFDEYKNMALALVTEAHDAIIQGYVRFRNLLPNLMTQVICRLEEGGEKGKPNLAREKCMKLQNKADGSIPDHDEKADGGMSLVELSDGRFLARLPSDLPELLKEAKAAKANANGAANANNGERAEVLDNYASKLPKTEEERDLKTKDHGAVANFHKIWKERGYYHTPEFRRTNGIEIDRSFIMEVGMSLANLFVRTVADIQALWAVVFTDSAKWDGQCASLPPKFQTRSVGEAAFADESSPWHAHAWISAYNADQKEKANWLKLYGQDNAEAVTMYPHVWCELVAAAAEAPESLPSSQGEAHVQKALNVMKDRVSDPSTVIWVESACRGFDESDLSARLDCERVELHRSFIMLFPSLYGEVVAASKDLELQLRKLQCCIMPASHWGVTEQELKATYCSGIDQALSCTQEDLADYGRFMASRLGRFLTRLGADQGRDPDLTGSKTEKQEKESWLRLYRLTQQQGEVVDLDQAGLRLDTDVADERDLLNDDQSMFGLNQGGILWTAYIAKARASLGKDLQARKDAWVVHEKERLALERDAEEKLWPPVSFQSTVTFMFSIGGAQNFCDSHDKKLQEHKSWKWEGKSTDKAAEMRRSTCRTAVFKNGDWTVSMDRCVSPDLNAEEKAKGQAMPAVTTSVTVASKLYLKLWGAEELSKPGGQFKSMFKSGPSAGFLLGQGLGAQMSVFMNSQTFNLMRQFLFGDNLGGALWATTNSSEVVSNSGWEAVREKTIRSVLHGVADTVEIASAEDKVADTKWTFGFIPVLSWTGRAVEKWFKPADQGAGAVAPTYYRTVARSLSNVNSANIFLASFLNSGLGENGLVSVNVVFEIATVFPLGGITTYALERWMRNLHQKRVQKCMKCLENPRKAFCDLKQVRPDFDTDVHDICHTDNDANEDACEGGGFRGRDARGWGKVGAPASPVWDETKEDDEQAAQPTKSVDSKGKIIVGDWFRNRDAWTGYMAAYKNTEEYRKANEEYKKDNPDATGDMPVEHPCREMQFVKPFANVDADETFAYRHRNWGERLRARR